MKTAKILVLLSYLAICIDDSLLAQSTPRQPRAGDVSPMIKLHRRKPNPQPLDPEISVQINRFFNNLMLGEADKIEKAYSDFLSGTRLANNPENVQILAGRTADAISALGPIFEYEHFDTQTIGKRILVATFLGWHEVQPLIWRFTFFRLQSGWVLSDLRIDDDLETIIE